jgi:hypothetical protein
LDPGAGEFVVQNHVVRPGSGGRTKASIRQPFVVVKYPVGREAFAYVRLQDRPRSLWSLCAGQGPIVPR